MRINSSQSVACCVIFIHPCTFIIIQYFKHKATIENINNIHLQHILVLTVYTIYHWNNRMNSNINNICQMINESCKQNNDYITNKIANNSNESKGKCNKCNQIIISSITIENDESFENIDELKENESYTNRRSINTHISN